ncbi:recombinase family protein [Rhizobium sp. RAF56]|uniref:recombinase family protein n=1 Tax=Rhizobium sp. RAF56 TaxID=3233062 RepID=UPI003F94F714
MEPPVLRRHTHLVRYPDVEADFDTLIEKAIAAIADGEPVEDEILGHYVNVASLVRAVSFREGKLLEQAVERLSKANPDLVVLRQSIKLPLVKAAIEAVAGNDWSSLEGVRLDCEAPAKGSYTPDLIIVNRGRHAASILDLKRSLASYGDTSRLEELKLKMMAAAIILPDWLYKTQKRLMIDTVGVAIVDGASRPSDATAFSTKAGIHFAERRPATSAHVAPGRDDVSSLSDVTSRSIVGAATATYPLSWRGNYFPMGSQIESWLLETVYNRPARIGPDCFWRSYFMTKVLFYARYSTDRQNEVSIETQVELGKAFVEQRGWTLVGTYFDSAVSGMNFTSRPGIQKLLSHVRRERIDVVLCVTVDRLSRDVEHSSKILKELRYRDTDSLDRPCRNGRAGHGDGAARYPQPGTRRADPLSHTRRHEDGSTPREGGNLPCLRLCTVTAARRQRRPDQGPARRQSGRGRDRPADLQDVCRRNFSSRYRPYPQ